MQPFETETGTGNPQPQSKLTYPSLDQNAQPQDQTSQPQDQNTQPQYPQQPQVQNTQPQGAQYSQPQNKYPQIQGNQYPQAQGGQYPQYQGHQYPRPQGGQYPQSQSQYPQAQGQYNQAQQPSYPNSQPYPQNYQAPYPNRPSQYPTGYPNYQGQPQPQYIMYDQGANKGQDDLQRRLMIQNMSKNTSSSGGGLVALYSLFAAAVAGCIAYTFMNQTNYQVLLQVYQKIAGRNFDPADSFSTDTCQAFLADIIAVPIFLFVFAAFNLFAMCVSFVGVTGCMYIQPLAAIAWGAFAAFVSQQKCVGYSLLTTMFGAENIPQNAWPYYGAMAVASVLACMLNYSWSNNKEKAQRDQRNLALMMASS